VFQVQLEHRPDLWCNSFMTCNTVQEATLAMPIPEWPRRDAGDNARVRGAGRVEFMAAVRAFASLNWMQAVPFNPHAMLGEVATRAYLHWWY
jgi:hypothetical protein